MVEEGAGFNALSIQNSIEERPHGVASEHIMLQPMNMVRCFPFSVYIFRAKEVDDRTCAGNDS